MLDTVKLIIAGLIVVAGIAAYYLFDEWLQIARIGVVVAAVILAMLVIASSQMGRNILNFASKARSEGSKVVWPTRKEATQITIIVLIGVLVTGIFIWLADTAIFWAVYDLILGARG